MLLVEQATIEIQLYGPNFQICQTKQPVYRTKSRSTNFSIHAGPRYQAWPKTRSHHEKIGERIGPMVILIKEIIKPCRADRFLDRLGRIETVETRVTRPQDCLLEGRK